MAHETVSARPVRAVPVPPANTPLATLRAEVDGEVHQLFRSSAIIWAAIAVLDTDTDCSQEMRDINLRHALEVATEILEAAAKTLSNATLAAGHAVQS
jgi:hypothetical protein